MDDLTFKRKHPGQSSSSRLFSRSDRYSSSEPLALKGGHISTTLRKHDDGEFDGDLVDWTMEGTGRRVAYDDFTTIGAIF